MKKLLFPVAILLALTFIFDSCCKEAPETIQGEWETVLPKEAPLRYGIGGNDFCWTWEEVFPGTEFCYKYDQDGKTLTVHKQPHDQQWNWDFEGPNIAIVTVTTPGEQDQVFLLRKR